MSSFSFRQAYQFFAGIILLTIVALLVVWPERVVLPTPWTEVSQVEIKAPVFRWPGAAEGQGLRFVFKRGLDIQGGMQVVLSADMTDIPQEDRLDALTSAREIILRRVDLYGIAEPVIQTAVSGDQYRLIVELPGVQDPQQALQLVGRTAQLEFKLVTSDPEQLLMEAGDEAWFLDQEWEFQATGLTGARLRRATVEFDPNTGQPVVGIEFDDQGRDLFAGLTSQHVGQRLAILIDDEVVLAPTINVPIIDGRAVIEGGFSLDEAQQLRIQLNAGALPVPISVLEQRSVGASLGQQVVEQSLQAGMIGFGLVVLFMVLSYGVKGVLASLALLLYVTYTLAAYKILGITLTLPGIAGLLLTIGMAVDANVLIFERIKEELREGRFFAQALELGFKRAWTSIKYANTATIMTALVLINPLDFPFLNTSSGVRGFGITLLIGVVLSLFTGVMVTRTFLKLFLKENQQAYKKA